MLDLETTKKQQAQALKSALNKNKETAMKAKTSSALDAIKSKQALQLKSNIARSYQIEANKIKKKQDFYNSLKQNPDWEELSKKSAAEDLFPNNPFKIIGKTITTADDISYDLRKSMWKGLYYLTEEQEAIFNYLYHTDIDLAKEYFYSIEDELIAKYNGKVNEYFKDFADENPVTGSLLSVLTSPLTVADGIGNLGEGIVNAIKGNGFTYDTNDDIFVHATNSLRAGASEDMGAVGKFIYNTGMSIADNLVRLPFGPTGAALMAMGQAASQNIVAGKQMGMSDGKAFLYGIITGGVEGLTEKISVDKLLDKTQMAKSVKGYILKNVISEGQEEAVSELADKAAQLILAGDEAEWRKEFAAYKAKGYSTAEAVGLVVANTVGDVSLAALSGAISGGVMGGGSVGVNAVQNNFADRKAGADINLGATARSELINAARASGSARVQNTLGKLQNADASGNIGRTNRYTGKLYRETFNEAYEKLHPYGNETETKKNGKLTHDAKVARKKLNAENARREEAGQASVVDEYNASEFGQKYKAFEDKLKNYNNIQPAKNAVAKNGKTTAKNDDTNIYTISDDGKTYVAAKDANGESTLKEAEISELTELKDGVPYVKLADGSVVSAKEMVLPENIAKQYKYASTLGNTEAAKAFISGYSNYEGSVEAYAEEFMTAYELGKRAGDRGIAEMLKTLPESRQKSIVQNDAVAAAFEAGKARAEKLSKDAAKTKKAREAKNSQSQQGEKVNTSDEKNSVKGEKGRKKRTSGNFTISEEVDTSKLTATQKMAIKRLEILSKCLGDVNIEVIDQGTNAEGKYESDNGYYDPATNTIYIDVNAGKAKVDGMFDYALVETLSHEVVHLIKRHSLADYEKLKVFLQDNVYTAVQWNSLVSERLAQYGGETKTTRAAAEEEVVANGCQTMLNSPRVLMALAKENYSLLERIKLRIANFFDRLTIKLGEHVNYTSEARLVMASTQKKQKALEKAFIDAVRNVRSNMQSTAESTVESTENAESQEQEIKASKRENDDANFLSQMSVEERNSGVVIADFIDNVNQMIDESKRSKRKKRIGVVSKEHAATVNKLMKTLNPDFSAEGYELWIDGTGAQHIERRHGKHGKADQTMATKDAKSLIPWAAQNADSGDFIRNENGSIRLSDRFYNHDGTKAPEIKLEKSTPEGVVYVSECVPDSANKRIWITSAYINKKGSKGQLLNIEDESSPQPTPEASFDSNATDTSISENSEKINSFDENSSKKSSKRENDETYTTEELANAFESIAKTKHEKSIVRQYKDNIGKRKELIDQRFALIKERSDWRGQKGSEAAAKRSELNAKIKNLSERISRYDLQLLNLQTSKPLREAMRKYVSEAVERERIAGEIYYGAVIARQKRKHKEELKAAKEKYKAQRAKAKDSENKRESKEKIIKKYKKLSKTILSPEKGKYVPQYLQGPLTEILTLITFDTTDTETNEKSGAQIKRDELAKKLRAVADKYDKLKEDELADYREEHNEAIHKALLNLVEVIEEADTKNVYEMNSETLVEVAKIINVVCETLVEARNAIHEGKAKTIRAIVDNIVEEQTRISKERNVKSDSKASKARKAARSLETKIISPIIVAREISGFEETAQFMELFNRFTKGQQDAAKFSMAAHKFFEDITTGKENKKKLLDSQTKPISVTFTDGNGEECTVTLTKQTAMQIILSAEREAANPDLNHIFNKYGGIALPDAKLLAKGKISEALDNTTDIYPTQEFVEKLKGELNAWDVEYMDRTRVFFNTIAKDEVNKTSLAVDHFEIATEAAYVPFLVDKKALYREVGNEENARNRLISSYSITKKLSKNANQRLLMPGLDVMLEDHIDTVAKYSGFAAAVKDFNKVWNSRISEDSGEKVSERMTNILGAKKIKVLLDAISEVQQPKQNEANLLDWVQRKFVPAKLLLNVGTVLKQLSSLSNAFAVLKHRMPFVSVVHWLSSAKNYKGICEEIDAHTAAHWQRRQGLSTTELGDLKTKTVSQRKIDKTVVTKRVINAIQTMDCVTAAAIWTLAKKDVSESGKYAADSAEYWDAVTKLYERALNETQATYDVMNRPDVLKGHGVIRYFTLFTTEDFKRAGMLYEAIMSRNWRKMLKTLMALIRSGFSFFILSALAKFLYCDFDDFLDDDGEFSVEAFAEYGISTLGTNAANTILPVLGGSIFETVEYMTTGDGYYYDNFASAPTVDFINQTVNSIKSLSTGLTVKKTVRAAALTTELFSGLPVLNAQRLYEAIKKWIETI